MSERIYENISLFNFILYRFFALCVINDMRNVCVWERCLVRYYGPMRLEGRRCKTSLQRLGDAASLLSLYLYIEEGISIL